MSINPQRGYALASAIAACLVAGCEATKPAAKPSPAKLAATPAPFVAPNLNSREVLDFNIQNRAGDAASQDPATVAGIRDGQAALEANDPKRAIAAFSRILATDPANVSALWGRANAYWQAADLAKAQADYDGALAHARGNVRLQILAVMSGFHFS